MRPKSCIILLIVILNIYLVTGEDVSLPPPAVSGNSVELCLNSRYSDHDVDNIGYGKAPEQWLSNVLWATGKAPITGSYRDIYVTKQDGKYFYNPYDHTLSYIGSGDSSPAAFYLSFNREFDFDAGVAYMFGLLASVSLWNGTEKQLASCPQGSVVRFSVLDVRGFTSELVATSSDSSLPNPSTIGEDKFEEVVDKVIYTNLFSSEDLSLQQLSQILWAGYGCTPHVTYNGRAGLTVPSAWANYYLTDKIYVLKENGVYVYHNRIASGKFDTRDHRIEQINSNDVRNDLKTNVDNLPFAPLYVIICIDSSNVSSWYARVETGFAAGNMLLQASALGIGAYFTTNLTEQEQQAIQNIAGIPSDHIPWAIVSLGYPAEFINITLEGYPIEFGNVNPGTENSSAIGSYVIRIGSETNVNVSLYIKADDFRSLDNVLGIENMSWNIENDVNNSIPMKKVYVPVTQNVPPNSTIPMYYWIDIPAGQPAGVYNTTIYIKAMNSVYRYW